MALCPNIQRVYVHIAWRRENHKGKILESINMDKIDLNALRDRAYKTACEHGFHDEELSNHIAIRRLNIFRMVQKWLFGISE